jgi:FkbM family methyltransferase
MGSSGGPKASAQLENGRPIPPTVGKRSSQERFGDRSKLFSCARDSTSGMNIPTAIFRKASRMRRHIFEWLGSDRYSHLALNNLDRKLKEYFDFPNGFFIEAGANDGLTQSNTYWFERFRGWRGVLIEAIPEKAAECRRNRPNARVINSALVADDSITSVTMTAANLMAYVTGSFLTPHDELAHLEAAQRVQNLSTVGRIEVPARPLGRILEEVQLPRIDLFSLDVEGYEIEVLKGLDVSRHRPRHILVETKRIDAVMNVLKPYYVMVEQLTFHDYLLRASDV